jgi:hypothetical protein
MEVLPAKTKPAAPATSQGAAELLAAAVVAKVYVYLCRCTGKKDRERYKAMGELEDILHADTARIDRSIHPFRAVDSTDARNPAKE